MDIRYSAEIADQLLKTMASYCLSIQNSARDMNKLLNSSDLWRDSQYDLVSACINDVNHDLEKTLRLQSEYLNTLDAKVKELRM